MIISCFQAIVCESYHTQKTFLVIVLKLMDFSPIFNVAYVLLMEKTMAPHSRTLAWKIPWMEEPSRLQSMGSLRVRHDWETLTFHFHELEKEMATHSSVLAWRIPGTEEPGGLPSMGSHRVGHDWSDLAAAAAAVYKGVICDINNKKCRDRED